MKVFYKIAPFRKELAQLRKMGKRIGFVPTMGNLHDGHLSLIKKCSKENDVCVLSIYVNPTQFGPNEDMAKYPRTLEDDLNFAKKAGCKIIFTPSDRTMYPDGFSTYVIEERISQSMEGKKRPSHFRGVLTIVTKLFNIVQPDCAYFGQKDAQQAILIKKLVDDLNINIAIKVLPIIRETSGLAMSSRNNYLTTKERKRAGIINKALTSALEIFQRGEKDASKIKRIVESVLKKEPSISIDYVELRSIYNLENIDLIKNEALLAVSVSLKGIHLIDNIILI